MNWKSDKAVMGILARFSESNHLTQNINTNRLIWLPSDSLWFFFCTVLALCHFFIHVQFAMNVLFSSLPNNSWNCSTYNQQNNIVISFFYVKLSRHHKCALISTLLISALMSVFFFQEDELLFIVMTDHLPCNTPSNMQQGKGILPVNQTRILSSCYQTVQKKKKAGRISMEHLWFN